MSTASLKCDVSPFFDQLRTATERLLLLDYDGTIAPFSTDRKRALPYPSVAELLESIRCTCRTRVVLISGRSADEIPSLLGLACHPEIWGVHGLERLFPDDRHQVVYLSENTLHALAEARGILDRAGLTELCEFKAGAVAVHWRGLSQRHVEEIRAQIYSLLSPLACRGNLLLTEFDGGAELKARGANKGYAVKTLLSETDECVPVAYLGDDATDEDAFQAMEDRGLPVLVNQKWRSTRAKMWIRPPEELLQFLNDWIRACGGGV
jgi:trehalose 6-phosphate phosphatase